MTAPTSEELLPCPFCGAPAKFTHISKKRVFAGCTNLKCPVGVHTANYATDAEAAEAWNSRAERTCHDVGSRWSIGFRCDVCGFDAGIDDDESVNFGTDEFNYCPSCGARVVYE